MAKKRKVETRGGKREGSGAKPKGERAKVSRTIYVDLLDWQRWRTRAIQDGFSGVSEWLAAIANKHS